MKSKKLQVGVVVSVFNEEAGLERMGRVLVGELEKLDGVGYEVVYVDDGSTDGSSLVLEKMARKNKRISVLRLAKNFGHEAAMLAGIDYLGSEVIVCIDGDLQHPPKTIKKMIKSFRVGNEIVMGKRVAHEKGDWRREFLNWFYYGIFNLLNRDKLEPNVTDFFLVSARVAKVLKVNYREQRRFLRAILQSMGLRKAFVNFKAPERKWGSSKYNFLMLLTMSLDPLLSFSPFALYVCLGASMVFMLLALGLGIFSVVMKFLANPVSGYTTLVVFLSGLAAGQFLVLGLVSYYVSLLVEEVKDRPIYTIDAVNGKSS